ncbi:MAG TPA: DUF4286 family protein [Myxococcaceae bacterium]|nr:DUF4286 family protein [Myxococcaceae bacterium]
MSALYAVTVEMSPAVEATWVQWMESTRIPEMLREPGFIGARLWKETVGAEDGWVRYVCHFELEELEAVERYVHSEAAQRMRAEGQQRFGKELRISRSVFTEIVRFVGGGVT